MDTNESSVGSHGVAVSPGWLVIFEVGMASFSEKFLTATERRQCIVLIATRAKIKALRERPIVLLYTPQIPD